MIIIEHNLVPSKFMWLWAKYVTGVNLNNHCTNALRGKYSKKLSKHNEKLSNEPLLVMNECPPGSYGAIYICGVSKAGYSKKKNYPHNLHAAIRPATGGKDTFEFEDWSLSLENGVFDEIPSLDALPERFRNMPEEFITCRIFRWAVMAHEKGLF